MFLVTNSISNVKPLLKYAEFENGAKGISIDEPFAISNLSSFHPLLLFQAKLLNFTSYVLAKSAPAAVSTLDTHLLRSFSPSLLLLPFASKKIRRESFTGSFTTSFTTTSNSPITSLSSPLLTSFTLAFPSSLNTIFCLITVFGETSNVV